MRTNIRPVHGHVRAILTAAWCFSLFAAHFSVPALALEKPKEKLESVGLATERGDSVDLSLTFTDSDGTTKTLGELVAGTKPIILIPAYYSCPRLCGLLLKGVSELLNKIDLTLGEDFRVVTVSFNTREEAADAHRAQETWRSRFQGKGDALAWHFLVGDSKNVDPLMEQIGFRYLPDGKEFAHTAAIMLLTPSGEISQYFTGISFPTWDVRLALIEASRGEIGTAFDQVLLYCFRFDPTKGKYTWFAFNVVRAGGAITLILLAGLIFVLWRRDGSGRDSA